MPRAAVTWVEDNRIRVAPLSESGANFVGRAPGSTVHLAEHDTVSRQHALFRLDGNSFVVEHLSRTNPTLLNGASIQGHHAVSDGDVVEVGPVQLAFHDLMSGEGGPRGATCHYCNRHNSPDRYECWHCGSSLVNAVTVIGGSGISMRMADAAGARVDLVPGQHLEFDAAGGLQAARGIASSGAAAIEMNGAETIASPAGGVAVEVNGEPITAPRRLSTGDLVRVAGATYICILRA